ncbi:DinB family protein [Clostridium cellulovorans]|uniref:DinB-like domain-containing protein n=1 Tax=Clostridium cellulovorans (strain ATCC 35296 / DSM 3052 / OCM 3 / 743B) TaxID=573061 RepID=D9SUX8_CLOC7|nr:DinB family protein [Clostridium cellulovorans]ADL52953.1 hypothetical protein Clocel_3268 [Clostridium cellulovorans 743B]
MDLKSWNNDLKNLRQIILKEDKLEESKKLFFCLHARVHSSNISEINEKTFEDELWENLDEDKFRTATNEKGRTIAYGMWHCTRIEDITMNILVAKGEQVLHRGNWKEKINSGIIDTGNSLTPEQILEFSKTINMKELKNYRAEVGRMTRNIVKSLTFEDMKKTFQKHQLQRIIDEGAVLDVEASNWLIDFWGKKNVSGILLMPGTRHHVVHLNESFRAKKKS